jgi:hypothetical protein
MAAAALAYAGSPAWGRWHGSGGFGIRRLTSMGPLLAVGLAMLFDRARRYRSLPVMIAGALIVWSVGITLRYVIYLLPHAPYALQALGLRPILLSPEPFPVGALLYVAQRAWFGALLRTLDGGSLLILGVCLLTIVAAGLAWRRYPWRTGDTVTR